MHKHSEPEKEELKFKQIPPDLLSKKQRSGFFASDSFNIPYQVCLTGTCGVGKFFRFHGVGNFFLGVGRIFLRRRKFFPRVQAKFADSESYGMRSTFLALHICIQSYKIYNMSNNTYDIMFAFKRPRSHFLCCPSLTILLYF